MGSGASSGAGGAVAPDCAKGAGTGRTQASTCSTSASVGEVEGGVHWLAQVVDKEKAEKDWLAKQYDLKCNEVKELQKEVASLREELAAARGGAASPSAAPRSEAAQSSEVKEGKANLMGRRGLSLTIGTGTEGRRSDATRPSPPASKESAARSQTTAPGAEAPKQAPKLVLPTVPGADTSGAAEEDPWKNEPMSALLKRRKDRLQTMPPRMSLPAMSIMMQTVDESENPRARRDIVSKMGLDEDGNPKVLKVEAPKIASLEDCPMSPKRSLKTGTAQIRRGQTEVLYSSGGF